MQKTNFTIKGMHCASCASLLEKALRQIAGVKIVSINYGTEHALVEHDGRASFADFKKVVHTLGYHAYAITSEDYQHTIRVADTQNLNYFRNRFLLAFILAIPVLFGSFSNLFSFVPKFLTNSYILLLFTLPVQFYVGYIFYRGFWYSLKRKSPDIDTLIALGISAAFIYSVLATFAPTLFTTVTFEEAPVYYDLIVVVVTLLMFGRYLEILAKKHASDSLRALMKLQPTTALVIRHGKEMEIPLQEVLVGDLLLVQPGHNIPVDGILVKEDAYVDESMLTGESIPLHKQQGMKVLAGTLNKEHAFPMQATAVGKHTVLASIIATVHESQSHKIPLQKLADKVSNIFVFLVLILAIISFILWFLFGPEPSFILGLLNAVAVLIIACPCALGLATPLALVLGTGKAAKKGILIKNGETLELIKKVDVLLFDKTGTLTKGKPTVTDLLAFQGDEKTVLKFAALAEHHSEHPLARAIVAYARQQNILLPEPSAFQAYPGRGIGAKYLGKRVLVGNRLFMREQGISFGEFEERLRALEASGKTVVLVAINTLPVGIIGIADTVQPYAAEAIHRLQRLGKKIVLITGDHEQTAQAIARQLHISTVLSEVLPQDKALRVKELQEQGYVVAMVGDGINDAPALAQADVGIALGSGTDVAVETGQVILMKNDLRDVVSAIDLSMLTVRKIQQNLFWAFAYNILALPVAAGILYPFTGFLLSPMIAGIAMVLSSLSVVGNSLLMEFHK